ncbi:MAG TPA: acyltransferase [Caulobacteraceae bacterium]|nr:acyltransferase [Caulobacteraceae bacterium]
MRLAAIDLLRIFAAAIVVAFHYLYLFPLNGLFAGVAVAPAARALAQYGYLGVELFFMISGYVISLSAEGRTRAQFAYARAVRLWPAFVICMTLTIAVQAFAGHAPAPLTVVGNLTFLPKLFGLPYVDAPYWSLMYEVLFYAAVAALLVGPTFAGRLRIFTAIWLALAAFGLTDLGPSKVRVLLDLDYGPYFAVGICVFLVRRRDARLLDWWLLAFAVVISVACAYREASAVGAPFVVHPAPAVAAAIVALWVFMIGLAPSVPTGARLGALSVVLGGLSYPIYLLHSGVGAGLVALVLGRFGPLVMLAGALLILALSYVVWRLELPIRGALSRIGPKRRQALGGSL